MKPIEMTNEPIEVHEVVSRERRKSTVENPCAFTHEYLRKQARRRLSRNEAIKELMELGVNESTARTQYQRWFKARKNKAEARKAQRALRSHSGNGNSVAA